MELKKTSASWQIKLNSICPHCEAYNDHLNDLEAEDLPQIGETAQVELNVTCHYCKTEYLLTEVSW